MSDRAILVLPRSAAADAPSSLRGAQRRSNPAFLRKPPLDCFALLAMTKSETLETRTKHPARRHGGGCSALRPPSLPSSPPGLTRWSMLTCRDATSALTLSELPLRMDCRVKPGNDDLERGCRKDNVKNRSRDASGARALRTTTTLSQKINSLPAHKREAERRKAHANHVRVSRKRVGREFAPLICSAAARIFSRRARLSALTLAALASGCHPDGSAPEPGFPKTDIARVLPAQPFESSVKHAPCGPVLVPVDRGPRAARARMANPLAGTAPRSASLACRPDRRPLSERVGRDVTIMGTVVKVMSPIK